MERVYKLTVNQEDLSEAEDKLENEGVNHLEFLDFREDYEEITNKPMFEVSDNTLLVVADEETLGRLTAFMLRGGVKTTEISDITNDIFYNKIELEGASDDFLSSIKQCLYHNFEEDDVFEKMKKLGGAEYLTEIDKRIIRKSSLK